MKEKSCVPLNLFKTKRKIIIFYHIFPSAVKLKFSAQRFIASTACPKRFVQFLYRIHYLKDCRIKQYDPHGSGQ